MAAVTVLGSGSWGTALAIQLARAGHDVSLWARNGDLAASIAETRQNATYLPGILLPEKVGPTADLAAACAGSEMLVFVCPSAGVRAMATAIRDHIGQRPLVVSAAKGVEQDSMLTMSAGMIV